MSFAPILMVGVLVIGVIAIVQRRSRRQGGRRRGGSIGAGASGAIYDLLNEDKRRAIEVIVEQKADATDPETADDTVKPPRNP